MNTLANDIAGAMAMAALMPLFMFGFLIISQIFWFCMFLDVTTNKKLVGIDKLTWVIVVIFTNWLGAGVYFFAGRPKQDRKAKRSLPEPRNIYAKESPTKDSTTQALKEDPQYHPVICRCCGKTASHNRYEFNSDKKGICPNCSTDIELA